MFVNLFSQIFLFICPPGISSIALNYMNNILSQNTNVKTGKSIQVQSYGKDGEGFGQSLTQNLASRPNFVRPNPALTSKIAFLPKKVDKNEPNLQPEVARD